MTKTTEQIYDELLVLRCQDGDPDAAAQLVRRWQGALVRFATLVTGDPDSGHDAVQEAWIAILKGISGLRDPASYRSWMFRIVNNRCIDLARSRSRLAPLPADERKVSMARMEDAEQIETILGELGYEHRVVLALHYLHDMEVTEISDLTGAPEGTVKSRLYHAREAFRRVLESTGDQNERPGHQNREDTERRVPVAQHI